MPERCSSGPQASPAQQAAYDQVQELLARVGVAVAVATSWAPGERTDRRLAQRSAARR